MFTVLPLGVAVSGAVAVIAVMPPPLLGCGYTFQVADPFSEKYILSLADPVSTKHHATPNVKVAPGGCKHPDNADTT